MAEVAHWLRQSRHLSGLTYQQLEQATGWSRGSLHRAASGWPSRWLVVEAFTLACGTDVGTARTLWLKAKEALEPTVQDVDVMAIEDVGSFDELRTAMGQLRDEAGQPSLRELVGRSGRRLRRSSLAAAFKGSSPLRRDLVVTFVDVLGVKGAEAEAWGAAWDRAQAHWRATRGAARLAPLDVTVSPAVLAALGDIPLDDWVAIAELVDVILKGGAGGGGLSSVAVDFRDDTARPGGRSVTVSGQDGGFGREAIEQSLRASWTGGAQGQNVFGASFLIACLRLGSRITLRTARKHDAAWTLFTLDLGSLIADSTWRIPISAEPKKGPAEQGTRITIEALRSDWSASRLRRLRDHLGDAYSYPLRQRQVCLTVSERLVSAREPCIWGENRFVQRRGESVCAVQQIDVVLGTLYWCQECGQESPLGSPNCGNCGGTRLERTEQRVWGWLGVQRYLHPSDYGIDFYRGGRKVLIRDKSLFSFGENPDHVLMEYPADLPMKGRLVGEIHCDHVPVTFTKTAFNYDSPEWRAVVHAVRGFGPLSPGQARRLGYAPNTSPLARLFSAFRRNDPGLRCLVPGDGAKAVHETAFGWGKRFRLGDPAYQGDERWYDAALKHDTLRSASRETANDHFDALSQVLPPYLGQGEHQGTPG
ncbi:hypothetical protein [Streptomyces sp. NPDC093568]|uniref:hypothetical protein n=1 Tax=Streptomyces sp. NPDC093568 TaxID=3366041 RepID=UPI0037F779AD